MKPLKITLIGAGAFTFPIRLIGDLLSFEALRDSELCLMDIDIPRAKNTERLARILIDGQKFPTRVTVTDDLDVACKGTKYIIVAFQVGGLDAYKIDQEIPARYGIDLPVADTLNAGGVMRGLRSLGALEKIAAKIREHCPDAVVLNYANPMSILTWGLSDMGVKVVGLCHSVQVIPEIIGQTLNIDPHSIRFSCYGVNHQAWVLDATSNGKDIYPAFREAISKRFPSPADGPVAPVEAALIHEKAATSVDHMRHYLYENVRTEIMRMTGYFHTESSHHGSEYCPWFRKNKETIDAYIAKRWDYYQMCSTHSPNTQESWTIEKSKMAVLPRSVEYGAPIINALETGEPFVFHGNVPNWGQLGARPKGASSRLISNLPDESCVEVACLVNSNGIQPTAPGALPPVCAAMNKAMINVQELTVRAHQSRDPKMVEQAVAMDPLTSVHLTLPKIRAMTNDLMQAQRQWLPQFFPAGK